MEYNIACPIQCLVAVIALLGKPQNNGERPIALIAFLMRLWTAMRADTVNEWEDEYHGHWDTAIRKSSNLRVAIYRHIQQEIGDLQGHTLVSVCWDADKI